MSTDSPLNCGPAPAPDTVSWDAVNLANVALALRFMERYAEAIPVYAKCLQLERSRSGEHSPEIALYLSNLGITEFDAGQATEGYADLKLAVDLAEPGNDLIYPIYLANLAILEQQQGNVLRSIKCAEEALQIADAETPLPSLPLVLEKTGRLYMSLGETKRARSLLERFLKMQSAQDHPQHPLLLRAKRLVASLESNSFEAP